MSGAVRGPRGHAEPHHADLAERPHRGSNPLYPTPTTQVADNDQGLGEIVDAISHSPFWSSTATVRTIEQILGLPPMNELDASADPMWSAFTRTPDLTPYTALVPEVVKNGPVVNPPLSALWHSTHDWAVPYPGDGAVLTPLQVLHRYADDDLENE